MRIQINDKEIEFVNEVSDPLHQITGEEQRIRSAYDPQSNGLVNDKIGQLKILSSKF